MLSISAVIIFVCTLSANAKKFRYPKINCNAIKNDYIVNGETNVDVDAWIQDATKEYGNNYPKQMEGKPTFYTG